jgi:hypothetical protein
MIRISRIGIIHLSHFTIWYLSILRVKPRNNNYTALNTVYRNIMPVILPSGNDPGKNSSNNYNAEYNDKVVRDTEFEIHMFLVITNQE